MSRSLQDQTDCLEFKEIRKEWKARKKDEEAQRKAREERERAAAQAAQANQVEHPIPDPSHAAAAPPAYAGVRPQLPPIGYQPADGQVHNQYGAHGAGGMVYQGNGQMAYPPNYPHSPYQGGYPQRRSLLLLLRELLTESRKPSEQLRAIIPRHILNR